eukprot:gnl/TRDRNA2_/TRDRNA2_142170_c0_seq1.p1 gnl/TRDRNA2_/TRDRNA2_142170_c0~~gnl/TRDRNA2_/TRDRNA2_142170_c0_seq1.p1  ORF type:complete len:268 (-),score=24.75 gnl/TRDRNA2_/TRDRNA2_142170_c0_seq1:35-838(-)
MYGYKELEDKSVSAAAYQSRHKLVVCCAAVSAGAVVILCQIMPFGLSLHAASHELQSRVDNLYMLHTSGYQSLRHSQVMHGRAGTGVGEAPLTHRRSSVDFRPQVQTQAGRGLFGGGKSEYSLIAYGTNLAKSKKAESEDSFFFKLDKNGGGVLAVADGVGSATSLGVKPGLYARMLAYEAAQATGGDLVSAIAAGKRRTTVPGAATLCMLEVDGTELRAANLGDSGFRIVRGGQIVFASPSLQYSLRVKVKSKSTGEEKKSWWPWR